MLKKMFGRKGRRGAGAGSSQDDKQLTIEDLVTLERYEEAKERLKLRLKNYPKDLHAHLKLAEVYVSLKEVGKALDEYLFVADSQAEDGFFDKGIAILQKAAKLAPGDDTLPKRIERYRRMKMLEKRRQFAIEGLLKNKSIGVSSAANSKIQVELLWNKIVKSHLVDQLGGHDLQKLFSVMEMVQTKEGQILAHAGTNMAVMYLVVDGEVEAGATINDRYMTLRSFTSGDLIGESVLLERRAWPADYKVVERGTLFRLDRTGLEEAMTGNEDPVAFISVLRQQYNDRDVSSSLAKLRA